MRKILLLLTFPLLSVSISCQRSLSLKDFCGEFAQNARCEKNRVYLLSFLNKKGAGLVTIEVTEDEYIIYKDGTRPIDCN